jgi:hypothetical protein
VRFSKLLRARHALHVKPRPSFRTFDPNATGGPARGDSSHVNNVGVHGGRMFVSGTALPVLYEVVDDRLKRYAKTSYGTHNARPFRDGTLFNHTRSDRIVYASRSGETLASVPLPTYPTETLEHADLPEDLARPTFGRGLTVLADGRLVGGSSPATISVYDLDAGAAVTSVNISMDVRNAVHGLEVWPFDD